MQETSQNRPKPRRIAAIDYGMARIGIAVSDERQIIASPLCTITTEKKLDRTVAKLLSELQRHQDAFKYELEEIVVGLPLLLSGKVGLLADEVHHFVEQMRQQTTVPIKLWDERLTSVQAERSMREGNMSRKKRSQRVDTVAAVILLQSYLDLKALQR